MILAADRSHSAEFRVPAATAYLSPDVRGARVSPRSGITGWKDPQLKVLWFGQINTPGQLHCAVQLRLGSGQTSRLQLTVAGQSHEVEVTDVVSPSPARR